MSPAPIHERPADLLAELVRFDTTNPPGNEAACIDYIDGLLSEAGVETERFSAEPERPNLLATLPGRGEAPPLLLQGHVDVVPTEGQDWSVPPFEGRIEDGYVWGRGTLDMKGGVTMMLASVLRMAHAGERPAGDVLFLALSDEERGGDLGAAHVVANHPEKFADVEYALGEFGGYPMRVDDTTFYPVQVAEKQVCWLKATFDGPGGHASRTQRDGPMNALGRVLTRLTETRLPVHITPAVESFVTRLAEESEGERAKAFEALLDPETTDEALDSLGPMGDRLDAMLHNTVSPTIVDGGGKINVHPSEATLRCDGRLLPGMDPETFLAEVRDVVGDVPGVEFEVERYEPSGDKDIDLGLFDLLADVLREQDPEAVPTPYLLTAATDGRYFDDLGIQTYGYTPLDLPPEFEFSTLAHAADERVPVEAVEFGTDAIHAVLQRYGEQL